jgi:hypothetical protein
MRATLAQNANRTSTAAAIFRAIFDAIPMNGSKKAPRAGSRIAASTSEGSVIGTPSVTGKTCYGCEVIRTRNREMNSSHVSNYVDPENKVVSCMAVRPGTDDNRRAKD